MKIFYLECISLKCPLKNKSPIWWQAIPWPVLCYFEVDPTKMQVKMLKFKLKECIINVICKMVAILGWLQCVNSLRPSDAIWWQRTGSTLAQVMAYYIRSWKGGILVLPCPSVRLSVCGQKRVRSMSSTILIGSISYLHIWPSNFRRCVACNARFKIQKFEILANILNL